MKKIIVLLSLISATWGYSMEISSGSSPEKTVTLCNGDSCIRATITPYDAERDKLDVQKLLDEDKFKLPHITPEFLVPYFSQKTEAFEQSSPTGFTVSGNMSYCMQVLKDRERAFGIVAYLINKLKKPDSTVMGNIVLLSTTPSYRDACEEQLLTYALEDMSHKKAIVVNIMMHEDNVSQRSMLEKMGFIDNTPQVKATTERLKKSMPAEQIAAMEASENQHPCYYMKTLEENVTEEMKNPKPIESTLLNITHENFGKEVTKADKPVVIDVYTDWCGPCRLFAPIVEEIAASQTSYKFVRFNCKEEEKEFAKTLDIEAFPTTLFVKDGKVIGKETGFMSTDILQQKLAKYFA